MGSARNRGTVEQEFIDNLKLEAHSLLNPIEHGRELLPCLTQGVRTGDWDRPESLSPGPWLVMSAKESAASVRPAILVQPGYEPTNNGRLRDAIAIADEKERRECIDECIKRMTGQYDHKDWQFIFETLEAFRHLPATTLDLWDCFARNPHAMAMLLIETGESNYQRVIELANELPFAWELVPFNAWLEALCTLREFIRSSAPEGMADMLVEHGVNEKLKYVIESDALLEKMVFVLSEKVIGKAVEDLKDAMVLAVPDVIDQLITSASNDLKQRQGADVRWAEFHGGLLDEIRIQSPTAAQSLYTNQADYH
ncbi:MAG: hypothetical protein JMN27_18695 [gamma proteobacterium endosymbiont of Lamellibrachia anaximandri]|nr:hypothetical protein [gamma proteobacterium endosymbiont of Lamellibrachia anaximandri]MBL3535833.1 hypothetical protein [gamma proteobacterium endosymbiont of Lamellibrachia anaximandri]